MELQRLPGALHDLAHGAGRGTRPGPLRRGESPDHLDGALEALVDEAIGAQNALESDWFSVLNSAEQAQLQDMLERVLTRIDRPAETPAAD